MLNNLQLNNMNKYHANIKSRVVLLKLLLATLTRKTCFSVRILRAWAYWRKMNTKPKKTR